MNEKIALKQLEFMGLNNDKMRLAAEKWKNPWQTLVSIILSARTRDEKTIPVAKKLFEKFSSSKKLANAELSDVKKIIKPINFYKTKSKNIINCSRVISKKYKGKVPDKMEELIELSGVGRKTANVFISETGGEGIGIDTHVSYISQKLGWTSNKNPHKIEIDLKELFSKKYWNKVNATLVRFGKTHTSRKEKDRLLEEIEKIK